ncbi:uncharacterized protein EI90DRAFT_3011855 [Cantharellus anzutake]|uniref:uncharacterized protein n=1 Tax=Cantharellus anzutake TaxID=1750568 RepID=UPI00190490B6|nr:uncharacterized protein EI90DRAFT_3023594 [Cantharellus anzutake]XP_038922138.1 uncharacterized protein EI90DRAFT_3011855 [Cantharellus anzutake]KAF8311524.1 hypothetical protein EI90DRAFT_3023594 [Cantharellus anzutake]KAF8341206.1 hypothetical protein EI90DRAFT_3011855 [Cantharellus anzutake]
MFSSNRVFAFLALFFTFASLFAVVRAAPVSDPAPAFNLVARDDGLVSGVVSPRGVVTCAALGCNEKDILKLLTKLHIDLKILIGKLDGHANPWPIVTDICAVITATIELLAAIAVNISVPGELIAEIVAILVEIIISLATCVTLYGPLVTIAIAIKIDVVLLALVSSCCGLIPTLLVELTAALVVHLELLQTVRFVLTCLTLHLKL